MLEKAELTLISMLSKTKKVITTHPPVLCSVASCKLFYSTVERVGTLSLLFVPPAKGGGMEISMTFTKDSVLVKTWVSLVLAGTFTLDQVPTLFNLKSVVTEIVSTLI